MFKLPELPYSYDALEPFIDKETMHIHHDGHHGAYVKNLNEALKGHPEFLSWDIEELLKSLDKVPEVIRTKVKNNAGGHYHHSIFWTMLGSNIKNQPEGNLLDSINQNFGSFDTFKEQFNKSAAAVFGSGWTWLVTDQGKLSIVNTLNQDSPVSMGQKILLGIDLWEHAYYLSYKNKRADWIESFWKIINWDEIENRFQ